MIDLRKVQLPIQALHTRVGRRGTVSCLLALCLGAVGVTQALAAPSLDPRATYAYDQVQNETVIYSPANPIGALQTIRQTYDCGGGIVQYQGNLLGFFSRSSPGVTATEDGGGPAAADVSVLFTNWTLSDAQYRISYVCSGNIPWPGTPPQAQVQPTVVQPTATPVPTPAPTPTPMPQSPQTPGYYYPYWLHSSSHW